MRVVQNELKSIPITLKQTWSNGKSDTVQIHPHDLVVLKSLECVYIARSRILIGFEFRDRDERVPLNSPQILMYRGIRNTEFEIGSRAPRPFQRGQLIRRCDVEFMTLNGLRIYIIDFMPTKNNELDITSWTIEPENWYDPCEKVKRIDVTHLGRKSDIGTTL